MSLASLTPRRLLELARDRGSASRCLAAVRAGHGASHADCASARSLDAAAVETKLRAASARLIPVGAPGYPPALNDLYDPPAGLFVRGEGPAGIEECVAMVGARNASPSGRETAVILARALAAAGGTVISGAARGIDAAAHEGALKAGGRTIAILGSGIDVAYPAQNRGLIQRIAGSGGVLSEYPPGVRAEPFRFPARNRIVAALARAVVVVQGAKGSGSMITADHALDLGRDVFAVPGEIWSELAEVPLQLIRDGAALIRGPDDLLGDLHMKMPSDPPGALDGSPHRRPSGTDRVVWKALTSSMLPEALAEATRRPLPEVVSALVRLELAGRVRSTGGRYERRTSPRSSY